MDEKIYRQFIKESENQDEGKLVEVTANYICIDEQVKRSCRKRTI